MIDFDALFTKYILDWHKEHADKYTPSEIESMVGELYEKWAQSPTDTLVGLSPYSYFKNMESDKLIEQLKNYCIKDLSPTSLLLDEIVSRASIEPELLKIVKAGEAGQLTVIAVNLLNELQSDDLGVYIFPWIFNTEISEELRELAAEIIALNPDPYLNGLMRGVSDCDEFGKTLAADILVNVPDDDRIYEFLLELFRAGENIPLFASYLGKYGNPDAITHLKTYLETANYMEFLEISNAIERLGGHVDFEKDWSEDYYYKALKGIDGNE